MNLIQTDETWVKHNPCHGRPRQEHLSCTTVHSAIFAMLSCFQHKCTFLFLYLCARKFCHTLKWDYRICTTYQLQPSKQILSIGTVSQRHARQCSILKLLMILIWKISSPFYMLRKLHLLFVQNFKLVIQSKDTFIHLYVNMACVQRQLPLTQ